jgi:hypothetical protein
VPTSTVRTKRENRQRHASEIVVYQFRSHEESKSKVKRDNVGQQAAACPRVRCNPRLQKEARRPHAVSCFKLVVVLEIYLQLLQEYLTFLILVCTGHYYKAASCSHYYTPSCHFLDVIQRPPHSERNILVVRSSGLPKHL